MNERVSERMMAVCPFIEGGWMDGRKDGSGMALAKEF